MWQDALRRLKGLPPVVWGLGLVSLLTDAASDMVVPLLPALMAGLGGGALALGVMEGLAEATSAAIKVGTGAAVDRGARTARLVVVGYGLAAIVRPLYALAGAPWHAAALRSADRVGKGLRSAPRDGLIAAAVERGQRGLAFGVHRSMDNLGAVLGGGLAFVLLGLGLSLEQVLLASIVPGVLSTVVAIAVTRRAAADAPRQGGPAEPGGGSAEATAAEVRPAPLPPAAKRLLIVIGVFSLSASADTFLLAHLARQGLALQWLPLAWVCLQLAKAALNVPGGAIADRVGPKRALVLGWVTYALTYAAFALSPSPWVTWLLFLLYGVFYGLTEGAEKAFIAGVCPPGARGKGFGALAAITGAALLPANVLFGAVYDVSAATAFWLTAALALAAAMLVATLVPSAPEVAP